MAIDNRSIARVDDGTKEGWTMATMATMTSFGFNEGSLPGPGDTRSSAQYFHVLTPIF